VSMPMCSLSFSGGSWSGPRLVHFILHEFDRPRGDHTGATARRLDRAKAQEDVAKYERIMRQAPIRLTMIVATIVAPATGSLTSRPSAIRTPDGTPPASQTQSA